MLVHRGHPLSDALAELDDWVSKHGNGRYWGDGESPRDEHRIVHAWEHPIQQVKAEIYEFARALYNNGHLGTILEIGLGQYGGTRYLWQLLFERVITIELFRYLVDRLDFASRPQDAFIVGDSRASRHAVDCILGNNELDALFIDGSHSYEAVLEETLLYAPLVRVGGMIAWHDTCQQFGIGQFVKDFAAGMIDGVEHEVTTIDLAHTGRCYGKHPWSPIGVKIGISYCKLTTNWPCSEI